MPRRARLGRRALSAHPANLARDLLGCVLVRVLDDGRTLAGRIVETEAYLGVADRACHSFAGRRTPRVEPMYAPGGTAYVYFTYGMHCCMNVVCGKTGEPVAVLLRALEPVEGLDAMRARRARPGRPIPDHALCRGPGNLCKALAIGLDLSGTDMTRDDRLWLARGNLAPAEARRVRATPRVGIGDAGAWTRRRLRFLLDGSPSVSRP